MDNGQWTMDNVFIGRPIVKFVQDWDVNISGRLALPADRRAEHPPSYWLAWVGAHLGDSWLWLLIMGWLWYITEDDAFQSSVISWIGCVVCATGVALLIKQIVHRPRPITTETGKLLYGGGPDIHSFPSGHASRMAAIATWGNIIAPGWGLLLWPLTLWIGWSRVHLSVHYVGDILAGYLLGWFISTLWIWIG